MASSGRERMHTRPLAHAFFCLTGNNIVHSTKSLGPIRKGQSSIQTISTTVHSGVSGVIHDSHKCRSRPPACYFRGYRPLSRRLTLHLRRELTRLLSALLRSFIHAPLLFAGQAHFPFTLKWQLVTICVSGRF